jgi:tetratricopeptide (TPR) repeat protein
VGASAQSRVRPRKSVAETLSATIASSGIDAAAKQYHDLKAAARATYNFDEHELNSLGYKLISAKKFNEAIRIFQLNVEAYPQSGNVYDSLGEAYMDEGNKPQAIANYQKSLQLNPNNRNAVLMLQKLNRP